MKKVFACLMLTWVSCLAFAQPVNDPVVTFKIKNFGLWVKGSFNGLTGEIRFDQLNPSNTLFNVSVDANSIETGIDLRDNHLRKEEYLYVQNYPRIKFLSSNVMKGDNQNEWIVKGHLTIKEVTKEISFPFLVEARNGYNLFTGEFVINRRDFDVGGKSFSMADELTIQLSVKN
jgi:polyisoprenoid-binding protein YceI